MKTRTNQEPIADLLAAVDALLDAQLSGGRLPLADLLKARRAVGEVKATTGQMLAVLEAQIKAVVERPIWNEHDLCKLVIGCDPSWLHRERKAGRWLHFKVDARGRRFYTPEQIIANLDNERPASKLKAA